MAPCISCEAYDIEEITAFTPLVDFILEEYFVILAPEVSVTFGEKLVFELVCPSGRFCCIQVIAASCVILFGLTRNRTGEHRLDVQGLVAVVLESCVTLA